MKLDLSTFRERSDVQIHTEFSNPLSLTFILSIPILGYQPSERSEARCIFRKIHLVHHNHLIDKVRKGRFDGWAQQTVTKRVRDVI